MGHQAINNPKLANSVCTGGNGFEMDVWITNPPPPTGRMDAANGYTPLGVPVVSI